MGEFESIGAIRRLVEQSPGSPWLSLGIGDDCCLLDIPPGSLLALSTDTMVEGVHFDSRCFSWRQAAYRACAAAISDLAAMAAAPRCMLAAASVPKSGGARLVDELAAGLLEAASRWSCPLAGGDLTATSGPVTLTITVAGRCEPGAAIRRSGASPGEEIWITGECGDSAAAVDLLLESGDRCGSAMETLPPDVRDGLLSPVPRLAEAAELLKSGPPTAMIDVSDGVAADVGHILDESGVGAVLEAANLPVGGYARSRAKEKNLPEEHYFLHGGEDFELLFTLVSGTLEGSPVLLECGTRITRIGRTTSAAGELLLEDVKGGTSALDKRGYDHLE